MRLYIETSAVCFWYDRYSRNREKRRATRRLLLLCRQGVHQGFVSAVVRQEIEQSRELEKKRDLALISRLALPDVAFDPEPYARLVEAYQREPLLAKLPENDGRHLAVFSVSDLEALVTYNLRHLANQVMLEAVRKVNHAEGIDKDLRTGPPEAFLPPH